MHYVAFLRKKRKNSQTLVRGKVKQDSLKSKSEPWVLLGWVLAFIAFIGIFAFLRLYGPIAATQTWPESAYLAWHGCLLIMIIYFSIPIIKMAWCVLRYLRIPAMVDATKSGLYYFYSTILLSVFITYLIKPVPVKVIWYLSVENLNINDFMATSIIFCVILISILIISFCILPKTSAKQAKNPLSKLKNMLSNPDFSLYLGQSTGTLTKRYHGSGIEKNQDILLSLKDAVLNILTLGGIGEGKTSCVISPLLVQFLDQGCGGLIFDIKGSFKKSVRDFADNTDKTITFIGPKYVPMNVIDGLTPEIAGEYLRSALLLHGSGGGQEKHWLNAATTLAINVFGILSFAKKHYTLEGLHQFLYDKEFKEDLQLKLDDLHPTLNDRQKRLLKHYRQQYENVFAGNNEKYQKDVMATMNEVLSPFVHPDIADAFCAVDKQVPDMKDVINGTVYLLDMPINDWGVAGKIVYMLIKMRFFSVVKQRQSHSEWDQINPIFFVCDEYQQAIDCSSSGLSDLNFWDTAKDAKCIGVISAQSINSFYAKIGDKKKTDTILQNFRQKICLKTEDQDTIRYFEYLAGKVEAGKYSYGMSESKTSTDSKKSHNEGASKNLSFVEKQVIDPQLFRVLKPDQAIACLNIDRWSMDDIIDLFAVYVD
jgi:hypothetical protein